MYNKDSLETSLTRSAIKCWNASQSPTDFPNSNLLLRSLAMDMAVWKSFCFRGDPCFTCHIVCHTTAIDRYLLVKEMASHFLTRIRNIYRLYSPADRWMYSGRYHLDRTIVSHTIVHTTQCPLIALLRSPPSHISPHPASPYSSLRRKSYCTTWEQTVCWWAWGSANSPSAPRGWARYPSRIPGRLSDVTPPSAHSTISKIHVKYIYVNMIEIYLIIFGASILIKSNEE